MIQKHDVVAAYVWALEMEVRRMQIEQTREETPEEAEERISAYTSHQTLELQFLAQFT